MKKFWVNSDEPAEEDFFSPVDDTHQLWSGRREAIQRTEEI